MTRQLTPCWPGECRAAVSLTFDDGIAVAAQARGPDAQRGGRAGHVLPQSARRRFSGEGSRRGGTVAKAGHEIGNHTIAHICSRAFRADPAARGLENMTLADIEKDIVEAKLRLQQLVPEQQEMSFCYPCYMEHVGCGPTRQSYVPVVARHHIAGRGKGEFPFGNHPATVDLHYAWSWPAERMPGSQMVGLVEACMANQGWGILTFHGIHEGQPERRRERLPRTGQLSASQPRARLDVPVAKVARRILQWRKENGI